MRISIRPLIKELLENENLIVNYNELDNGGFDLSVRINEKSINRSSRDINKTDNPKEVVCPKCCSMYVKSLYGIINTDGSNKRTHYICEDCQNEFEV